MKKRNNQSIKKDKPKRRSSPEPSMNPLRESLALIFDGLRFLSILWLEASTDENIDDLDASR